MVRFSKNGILHKKNYWLTLNCSASKSTQNAWHKLREKKDKNTRQKKKKKKKEKQI